MATNFLVTKSSCLLHASVTGTFQEFSSMTEQEMHALLLTKVFYIKSIISHSGTCYFLAGQC